MRILVTGSTGQLGFEVLRVFSDSGYELMTPGRQELDFSNPEQVGDRVRALHADWVINCAAYTAVDKAEAEPELAFKINADGPRNIAEIAQCIGARLIHVSTD